MQAAPARALTGPVVVVRGGGDLASGAIFRLARAGFRLLVLELAAPLLVRRTVCYGDAVFDGARMVEGITARRIADDGAAAACWAAGELPVLIDPDGVALAGWSPFAVVDARMEKRNLGTRITDAPCVVALGPGFTAGVDCHAVVETNRGHFLGRVYTHGAAEPDTGEPGAVGGKTHSRILRAPAAGHVEPLVGIGDLIAEGQPIAHVGEQPITAAFPGILRGLIHPSVAVWPGLKVGDLDPRADRTACFTLSDKSLAVGGGVLEAVTAAAYAAAQHNAQAQA